MSFKINNFVIDRVLRAYLLDSNDKLIGYLDQLTDATIEMGSESQDVTDAQGVLIKRFYRAKTATLNATSALLNLDVANLQLGSKKVEADGTASTQFDVPYSTVVKKGSTATLKGVKTGSVHVYGLTNSGNVTVEYEADTTADTTHYAITTGGVLTPPTNDEETQYFVFYTRSVTDNGVKYTNSANEFPQSVKIRIESIGYDACNVTAPEPQILIISSDSFNISPDASISISGGDTQTIDFSGEFAASYCSEDKSLFEIYCVDDSE